MEVAASKDVDKGSYFIFLDLLQTFLATNKNLKYNIYSKFISN